MNNIDASSAFGEVAKITLSSLNSFGQVDESKILEIRKQVSGGSSLNSRSRNLSGIGRR